MSSLRARVLEAALGPIDVATEERVLAEALGMVLAQHVIPPVAAPPFDRSNVGGFAVRAMDLANAGEARPVRLSLNG